MTGRRLASPAAGPAVLAAGLVLTAFGLASPAPAPAREASAAEVRQLASRAAAGEGPALASLRQVDRVDGRSVDLPRSLHAGAANLGDRLRSLAAEPARGAPDAVSARRHAREILAEGRYREPSFPRPLRGLFRWIGARVAPLLAGLNELIDEIASAVPGGRPVGFSLLAAAVVLGFAALSSRTLRLRSRRRADVALRATERARGPSAAELERAAADAERAGDLSLAVRLLFRAGLLRLDERGAIRLHPSLTTAAVARRLDSRDFTRIAAGFEEVAYGGRAAAPADVEAQRSGWPRVLDEARR